MAVVLLFLRKTILIMPAFFTYTNFSGASILDTSRSFHLRIDVKHVSLGACYFLFHASNLELSLKILVICSECIVSSDLGAYSVQFPGGLYILSWCNLNILHRSRSIQVIVLCFLYAMWLLTLQTCLLGSAIESTVKYILTTRFKQTGCHWRSDNAESLIWLRCKYFEGRSAEFWDNMNYRAFLKGENIYDLVA